MLGTLQKVYFFSCNSLEKFRVEVKPTSYKLKLLQFFRYERQILCYQREEGRTKMSQGAKELRDRASDSYDKHVVFSKSTLHRDQSEELEGKRSQWHQGELTILVKSTNIPILEQLISEPLGTTIVGEGLFGLGIDFKEEKDRSITIIAKSWGLLYFIDFFMNLLSIECKFQKELETDSNPYPSLKRMHLDIIYFEEDLEDAYAFGWDLVEYLLEQNMVTVEIKLHFYITTVKQRFLESNLFECIFLL